MRYYVKEDCIGCGMCAGTCPEIFHMTDEGIAEAEDKEVDATLKEDAQEAMEGCPVGAIEKQ